MIRMNYAMLALTFALAGCGGAAQFTETEDDHLAEAEEALAAETSVPTLPFAQNTTYRLAVKRDGVEQNIGFLFASPGVNGSVQDQRWILYEGKTLPTAFVDFARPGVERRYTTLDQWRAGIGSLWRAGATYVKCSTTITGFASTEKQFVPPANPGQLVDEAAAIWRTTTDGQAVFQGFAQGGPFAQELALTNTEYWTTSPDYAATIDGTTRLSLNVTVKDRFVPEVLPAGSTESKVSCEYFNAVPASP